MSYRIARRARTTPVDFLWVKPSASISSWWRDAGRRQKF
jgi:hypothetical protein